MHFLWCSVVHGAKEPNVARLKLAWWHEELSRLEKGQGVHPLSKGLRLPSEAADNLKLALIQHDANLESNAQVAQPSPSVYIQHAITALQTTQPLDKTLSEFATNLGLAWDEILVAQSSRPWIPDNTQLETLKSRLQERVLTHQQVREQRFGVQLHAVIRLWLDKASQQGKLPTLPVWRTLFASWRAVTKNR